MEPVWADGDYQSQFEERSAATFGWRSEAAQRPDAGPRYAWVAQGQPPPKAPPKGFRLLPRRRVVERTSGWLGRNRRLAKDHEGRRATGEV